MKQIKQDQQDIKQLKHDDSKEAAAELPNENIETNQEQRMKISKGDTQSSVSENLSQNQASKNK